MKENVGTISYILYHRLTRKAINFKSLRLRYYISFDGCCTEFIIYYFILYLFQVINDSISNLMMLIENDILLKNHDMLVVIHAKILHRSFIRQFAKTLNQFLYLSSANENLENCIQVWFEQLKKLRQFWGTFIW